MEFFNNAKAVRLKSHLEKYLVADDEQGTVRQSHDGVPRLARWRVERVEGNPHVIRLKSAHGGLYLAASDESYLLGMTGKKVLLQPPAVGGGAAAKRWDAAVEWEPIKEGYRVKLRTRGGKFLRANGATPPWRNSVTHDLPHRTATQDWVMWDVDVVDVSALGDDEYLPSSAAASLSDYSSSGANSPMVGSPAAAEGASARRSMLADYSSSDPNSPRVGSPAAGEGLRKSIFASERRRPSLASERFLHGSDRQDGMEIFSKAKAVRLQSHLGKYLLADDDETTVRQSRNGASSRNARWAVELVDGKPDRLRLKSCHGLYLTAAEEPFLLGMTGKKVLQTPPENPAGAAVEWRPVIDGPAVKLMTEHGKFLRANGGAPPWRNSVTHDVPHRTATQSWVLWGVEIVDIYASDHGPGPGWLSSATSFDSVADDFSGSPETGSPVDRGHGNMSMKKGGGEERHGKKSEGRLIYYCEVDDDGNFSAEVSFQFRGYGLEDLTEKLEDATGLEDVIVCSRNVLNGKLYPLRLALPPNNATMHVVVVPPTSKVANEFLPPDPSST